MKRDQNDCHLYVTRGTCTEEGIENFAGLGAICHANIKDRKLTMKFLSPDGKSIGAVKEYNLSEVKRSNVKKTLFGYEMKLYFVSGDVYKLKGNNKILFTEDKDQKEVLKDFAALIASEFINEGKRCE